MKYYKFTAETPFCGTDHEEYQAYEKELTEAELNEIADEICADNAESFDGLILLGSYSTEDLSSSSLKVLSVYGSEDTVMNMEKYNECEGNLPDGFTQVIIDGGCHAYFGMYGQQKGDGTPKITNDEQIYKTAQAISDHVLQQQFYISICNLRHKEGAVKKVQTA